MRRTTPDSAGARPRPILGRIVERCRRTVYDRLPDRPVLRARYRQLTGRRLDLDEPVGFSEKLNWLKLHDRSPLHVVCADKWAVRSHVRAVLGETWLKPLLAVGDAPRILSPDVVSARRFVAKTTHDYNSAITCLDRDHFDWRSARRQLARHLRCWHYLKWREWAYKHIPPRIIIEEFVGAADEEMQELKIYCFHGQPRLVLHVADAAGRSDKSMFDTDWRPIAVTKVGTRFRNARVPRPPVLETAKEAARALAAPFVFCRVDLLVAGGRLWFGEITFYPDGAMRPSEPAGYELEFGRWLDLSALARGRGTAGPAHDHVASCWAA